MNRSTWITAGLCGAASVCFLSALIMLAFGSPWLPPAILDGIGCALLSVGLIRLWRTGRAMKETEER